jgi:octopine/nopaline transport system ATP-binding protein
LNGATANGTTQNGAALEIRALHKSFGQLQVLRGISLAAQPGEVVAILGASGSGKSTMLRCCNLLEMPDSGDIVVDGEAFGFKPGGGRRRVADQAQVDRLRGKLGFVFQNFCLWSHMTVLQNVIEAPVHVHGRPRAEAVDEAEALLAKVGIADKRHHYPAHLSGGQQQRAAIARALAVRPKVLLFDEPTSALDPELVGEVLGVIRTLAAEGRTMLIVTHEMNFARDVANRVVFLHQGMIDCEGAPEAMFTTPPTERFASFVARATRG